MLLSNLNLLATASGGVARLRELILTLAVQGKLVPQDPSDEPASELLKKIRAEKDRLTAEGKIKRDKPLVEITEEEKPFALPTGWEWGQLTELGLVGSSSRVHQSDWKGSGVPFYRAREIVKLSREGHVTNDLFISEELYSSLSQGGWVPEENDIMITGVGTIGVPYVVRKTDRFYFKDASVLIFKNYGCVHPQYLYYFMQAPLWIDRIHAESMGTTVDTLTIARASVVPVPLPPLAEQSRIVIRVEELMRLCDALEAKGRLEAAQHAQLVSTLLGTLTQSATPEQLADNWQRIAAHFDLLLDRPQAVDALEQTILQLAVRGLLVPQDPLDEPASELLKKIRAEKDRLIAKGKIKRDKPLPPIAEEERPFELPQGWEWVRLGTASKKITDGTHHSPANFSSGDFMYLSAKNIKSWGIDLSSATFIPKVVHDEIYARCDPEFGDILYIKDGATTGVLAVNTIREPFSLLSSVGVIKPSCGLTSEYLALVLRSPFFYQAMRDGMSGVAITRVTLSKLCDARFPLPPLAEQSRIVTRVTSLRRLCTDLRQRLTASQSTQAHLAEALVQEVA